MTRNEYLIGLLMESADALMESAGRNGKESKYYGDWAAELISQSNKFRGKGEEQRKKYGNEIYDMYKNLSKKSSKLAHDTIARGSLEASKNREHLSEVYAKRAEERARKKARKTPEKMMEEKRKRIEERHQLRRAGLKESIDLLAEATDIMYGEY